MHAATFMTLENMQRENKSTKKHILRFYFNEISGIHKSIAIESRLMVS